MAKSKGCGCFPLLILLGAAGYGGYYWYEQHEQSVEAEAAEESSISSKIEELKAAEKAANQAKENAEKAIEEARQAEADAVRAKEAAEQAEANAVKAKEEAQQAEENANKAIEAAKKAAEEAQQAANKIAQEQTVATDSSTDATVSDVVSQSFDSGNPELDALINSLQSQQYTDEYPQMLQQRLLTLLKGIAHGDNINTVLENANGTTALHNACALGQRDIVIWLLQNGADARMKTSGGASVMDCIGNDPDGSIRGIIQSVMNEYEEDAGLAREELEPFIARIQSMKATSSNKLYRTRLLQLLPMILEGEDVNLTLPETKGNTALHYACGLGDVELVTWLLENGANPNKLTDKGMSPYKCAGGKQVKTIQNLLREYGGNP